MNWSLNSRRSIFCFIFIHFPKNEKKSHYIQLKFSFLIRVSTVWPQEWCIFKLWWYITAQQWANLMRNEILSETSFIITVERSYAIYLTHIIINKRATSTVSHLRANDELDKHFRFFTKLNTRRWNFYHIFGYIHCSTNSLLWTFNGRINSAPCEWL